MIKVISRNEESNKLFNVETNTNNANTTTTAANLYLNGFTETPRFRFRVKFP